MAAGSPPQDAKALAARVAQYHWHHSLDLGDGVVTQGSKSLGQMAQETAAIFDRVDFTGRSVIDIGAWHGTYSFEAKRRGAGRVLATDFLAWHDPQMRGRETFDLVKERLGLDVEAALLDVAETTVDRLDPFDIVLFLGVIYHVLDPVLALRNLAALTRELLIVETVLDMKELTTPAMRYCPGAWWAPNALWMMKLLQTVGFSEIEAVWHPYAHNRGIFFAWRSTTARRALPAAHERIDLSPNALVRADARLTDGRIAARWRRMRKET